MVITLNTPNDKSDKRYAVVVSDQNYILSSTKDKSRATEFNLDKYVSVYETYRADTERRKLESASAADEWSRKAGYGGFDWEIGSEDSDLPF